jgi:hypothetical protein
MDNGEVVDVDGSTLVDEDSGRTVPAVILRLPAWRAHALAHVLPSWNPAVDLFEEVTNVSQDESDLAWALLAASSAAGDLRARQEALRGPTLVLSGERARAAAVLKDRGVRRRDTDRGGGRGGMVAGSAARGQLLHVAAERGDRQGDGGRGVPGADRRGRRTTRGGTLRLRACPT